VTEKIITLGGEEYLLDVDYEAGSGEFEDKSGCLLPYVVAFDKNNEIVLIDEEKNKIVKRIDSLYLEQPDGIAFIGEEWWSYIEEVNGGTSCRPHIKRLEIAHGFKEIWAHAFRNWTALEIVILPPSVIEIHQNAFQNCPNLRYVLKYWPDGESLCDLNTNELLTLDGWTKVLANHPMDTLNNIGERACIWNKLNSHLWAKLLRAQPQYASKCKCFYKFNGYDWVYVLQRQPQFANECDRYDGWRKIDYTILEAIPDFRERNGDVIDDDE
jgi:hypothetical protein